MNKHKDIRYHRIKTFFWRCNLDTVKLVTAIANDVLNIKQGAL